MTVWRKGETRMLDDGTERPARTLDIPNRLGVTVARVIRSDEPAHEQSMVEVADVIGMPPARPEDEDDVRDWVRGVAVAGAHHPKRDPEQDIFSGGQGLLWTVGWVPSAIVDAMLPSLVALLRRACAEMPLDEE